MFPVYIKQPNSKPPETDVHYIIAKNGIFLRKRNSWIEATVPVKQISVLDEQPIGAKILLPNLPSIVMARVVRFFKAVYEKHKSEAAVLLHYSSEKGWEISVPPQKVTAAHADYDATERLEGYNCVGTMHSHARMSAFHSGTDIHDEAEQDGIHITIGDLDYEDCFSLDGEVVVNGTRFSLSNGFLEGLREAEKRTWLFSKDKKFYAVDCPSLNGWVVPEEWMSKVEKKAYSHVPATTSPGLNYGIDLAGTYGYGDGEYLNYFERKMREKLEENAAKKKKKLEGVKVTTITGKEVKDAG